MNRENTGYNWNQRSNACTKKYLTKKCDKNNISKFKCGKYHTELKKQQKKKN